MGTQLHYWRGKPLTFPSNSRCNGEKVSKANRTLLSYSTIRCFLCSSAPASPSSATLSHFRKSPLCIPFLIKSRPLNPSSSFNLCSTHSSIQSSSITDENKRQGLRSRGAKKILAIAISVAVGIIIRFLVPKPVQVSTQAWQLLAIFAATNVGLVLSPLPLGAWAFIALTTLVVTKTLSFSAAFCGFGSDVIWLVVISSFFARGFVKTGLGDRIATYFVKWLGKSALGLSYGLAFGELLTSPAMPSTIARAGGVFLPIINSTVSLSAGNKPCESRKLGAYLIMSQLHSSGHSTALFLTAAANNLLMLKLMEGMGVKIANPWVSWFKAASLPALVSLLVTPFILYKVFPPESEETLDAPAEASVKLEKMGPVTKNEWAMVGTMFFAVSFWIFGDAVGITSAVTAMLALSILVLIGVLDWDDCLNEKSAWDTLAWFSALVGMASQLADLGIVTWFSGCVEKSLQCFSLSWPCAFGVLQAAYFFIHYMFASQAAHIGALYSSFLAMHLASGVPGVLAALTLAFNSSLFGAFTHYSSAQAAAYYAAGYVDVPDFFRLGIIMAVISAVIWVGVGTFWWKFLGLY